MKMIVKIAGQELRLLFCSPVAWLLLIVFLCQFGGVYADRLANTQEVLRYWPGYTSWLFSSNLFPKFDSTIYLYIPLLTMGLMSNELSSGSIKLLFSSPISTRNIVLGKYLGIMVYWLMVIGLFCLFIIPAWFMIPNMDPGIILPGVLSIFLLACTYSAIGLFMSCLTTYQVVAALSTLTALAALNYVGNMWQGVPVLKDIVNFLHIAGHAENMNWGFIKSKDILYFIIITLLFLGLAVLYLEDTIQARSKAAKVKRYLIFTTVMISLGCVFSMRTMTLYFDTTAVKSNTINAASQKILSELKGPVSVTAYCNLLKRDNEIGSPEYGKTDFSFWEPYIRFLPQLELKYTNYYDQDEKDPYYISAKKLDSSAVQTATRHGWYVEDFLKPKEIRQMIDLKPEGYNFVRRLEYGNKKRFLRMFEDNLHIPTQAEIMTAFKGLVVNYSKIAFLTGHYERSILKSEDRDYKTLVNEITSRSSLINMGFDIRAVSIHEQIPMDIAALVIAEPLTAFSGPELQKIQAYIARGGNLLITGGAKSQKILNPIVKPLGVSFREGQLVQRNKNFSEDMVFTSTPLREGGDQYPFQFSGGVLAMPESAALAYHQQAGFKVEEAVVTDENTTWNKMGEISQDTTAITYNPENGDDHKALPVALSLTKDTAGKQQRIMVVGNGSFMGNDNLDRDYSSVRLANTAFIVSMFKWISNGAYPITFAAPAPSKDVTLTYTKEDFEKYKYYYAWLLPALVLIFGIVYLFRRRRK